ncbi:hypothetical protein MPH_01257 [Macrophomina phaseolina MS6]|uniref:Uncharacterized protein n=1 Tax=Macrophomina phaseolina (strain MS6) TaxID=1126212 RepID=K2S366_MACPH|nr:hypothetical protein MPH_01257 [Macrophomina phaseolina MS6]
MIRKSLHWQFHSPSLEPSSYAATLVYGQSFWMGIQERVSSNVKGKSISPLHPAWRSDYLLRQLPSFAYFEAPGCAMEQCTTFWESDGQQNPLLGWTANRVRPAIPWPSCSSFGCSCGLLCHVYNLALLLRQRLEDNKRQKPSVICEARELD